MHDYKEMIEWLMMLNRNPRQRQLEENMKPVTIAFVLVDEIELFIENKDHLLKGDKLEIDNALAD
jgi:hypothetical protein